MTITDLPPSAFVLDEWHRVHGDQADEEGWSIFEAEYEVWSEPWPDAPAGYVPHVSHIRTELQLQRVDDADVFSTDEDAWRWVWAHRGRPGTAEQDVLSLLARFSPVEFSRILALAYDWPI